MEDLKARVAELEAQIADHQHRHEEMLHSFIRHVPAAVAMFDQEMRYLMVSDRWAEDFGHQESQIKGKSLYKIFPSIPQRWKNAHNRCLKGVTESTLEDEVTHPDGYIDYINWACTPWYKDNGEIGGVIMLSELATEEVVDKRKLIELNQSLKISNDKLEQFSYIISHHLTDPLKLIQNLATQLITQNSAQEEAQQIVRSTGRLIEMVQTLLEYARMGHKLVYEPVNLTSIIHQVLSNLAHSLKEHTVKISWDPLPKLMASQLEMTILFQNLISNAIQYNHSEEIVIHVSVIRADTKWRFEIKDNGIGIPSDKQEGLFQLFYRADTDQNPEGKGMGLAICRKVIEHMGGEIGLHSIPGEGSVFYFTIPFEPES